MIAHARDPLPDVAPTDFRGLRVLIFGLGRFGGGAGAARFFAERGARVTVTDRASEEELGSALEELADLPIERFVLGHHDPEDFLQSDWVVVNPAIPPRNELLATAQKGGAELVSEMDLFLWWCPSHYKAGITGTNGKSTTCKLASAMVSESGLPTRLGGNIGYSLLPIVDRISPETRVVIELSSFQLARLRPATPRPQVVAMTPSVALRTMTRRGRSRQSYSVAVRYSPRTAPVPSRSVVLTHTARSTSSNSVWTVDQLSAVVPIFGLSA